MSDPKAAAAAEAAANSASDSRKGREIRALSWSAVSTIGGALINLGRAILLSRLLQPEQFGVFGLVVFALSAAAMLSDLGMGRFAIVANFSGAAEQRRFLDTAWTVGIARGAALSIVMACLAQPYAAAVHQRGLAPLLAACSAWFLIGSLANPGTLLLYRQLEQRSLALLRLGTDLCGLAITALLAWEMRTTWSLVIGWLAGAAFGAAVSYVVHPYRPRFTLDREMFRRGFVQGRHIAVVVALSFVTTQVDNLIVGRLLGAAALGVYLFAYRLATLPIDHVQAVAGSVAMAAYVRHRCGQPAALAAQLQRVLIPSTSLLCAGLLPVLLLRREIVLLLGGARWADAAPLLPPLLLLSLLRCTCIHLGTLLQSVERAELEARAKLLEAALFIPGCALAVQAWGLQGASWAGALVYALAIAQRTRALRQVLPGQVLAVTAAWSRTAVAALGMSVAGLLAEQRGASPLWVAPAALLGYVALALRLEPMLLQRVQQLFARRVVRA
jgi:O-antigen/teichoic acid export membrane protein